MYVACSRPPADPPEPSTTMIRSTVLIGTRPEAIKMAPVQSALAADDRFESSLVSTGQHREMLKQVLETFSLDLTADLEVMTANQSLAGLTSRLVARIDELLAEATPDVLLVQGDTTSVFAGALCGFYRGIPVGHVEAGLRTGNLRSPFPEEANRVLASRLVTFHFAPTPMAKENLLREGIDESSILVTGNTVIDALLLECEQQQTNSSLHEALRTEFSQLLADAGHADADLETSPYVLVTGHRRENFGGGFDRICSALEQLADAFPDHLFIYPVHLNPNVNQVVRARLGDRSNIALLPPLHYRLFIHALRNCRLVLTDSGGVQEEAPSLGKPVLVMRDTTERPEGIEAGTVKLVGTETSDIVREVSRLLSSADAYAAMSLARNPYGDGKASARIRDFLAERLS